MLLHAPLVCTLSFFCFLQGGGQWSRAKSFDTFCPLGPSILPMVCHMHVASPIHSVVTEGSTEHAQIQHWTHESPTEVVTKCGQERARKYQWKSPLKIDVSSVKCARGPPRRLSQECLILANLTVLKKMHTREVSCASRILFALGLFLAWSESWCGTISCFQGFRGSGLLQG